jgi:hypothetical protein
LGPITLLVGGRKEEFLRVKETAMNGGREKDILSGSPAMPEFKRAGPSQRHDTSVATAAILVTHPVRRQDGDGKSGRAVATHHFVSLVTTSDWNTEVTDAEGTMEACIRDCESRKPFDGPLEMPEEI